jgi:hypothetical protein
MPNETGDMKILGNFRRLIDLVKTKDLYNPSNTTLSVANLEAQLALSISAVEEIGVKIAPNKFAIDARQTAYAEALSLVRGSRNLLKASGASLQTIEDANTFARKTLGLRKSKKKTDNPNTTANEATKNHSASQQSYDAILGNFRSYIEILKNEALYNPNEQQYKTNSLEQKATDLADKNNAVSLTFVPLNTARSNRDDLLYTDENSLCSLAAKVKAYAKAVFGSNSSEYRTINALSFKRSTRTS